MLKTKFQNTILKVNFREIYKNFKKGDSGISIESKVIFTSAKSDL